MNNKNDFKRAVEEIGSLDCLKKVMEYYGIHFEKESSGYKTHCVFHSDKTPSLKIYENEGKAYYNCFGCSNKGDIINFICEMENCDNAHALEKAYEILGKKLDNIQGHQIGRAHV